MPDPLIPTRFLFRFALPCLYRAKLWTNAGIGLDESHRLLNLCELEGRSVWADVRAAWSESGVALSVRVQGKKQAPWCRTAKLDYSDGLQVWIDTRDVHNVHRAGRFCHRFLFLPVGAGRRLDEPLAQWMSINRAKEHPRPVEGGQLKVRSEKLSDGYHLEAFVAGEALTGFDPQEHPRLGFTYAVLDRELGEQTLTVGSPMPYQEDPGLWATLEMQKGE
jgi:hypothetical protein